MIVFLISCVLLYGVAGVYHHSVSLDKPGRAMINRGERRDDIKTNKPILQKKRAEYT